MFKLVFGVLASLFMVAALTAPDSSNSTSSIAFADSTLLVAYHLGSGGSFSRRLQEQTDGPTGIGKILESAQSLSQSLKEIYGGPVPYPQLDAQQGITISAYTPSAANYFLTSEVSIVGNAQDWAPIVAVNGSTVYVSFMTNSTKFKFGSIVRETDTVPIGTQSCVAVVQYDLVNGQLAFQAFNSCVALHVATQDYSLKIAAGRLILVTASGSGPDYGWNHNLNTIAYGLKLIQPYLIQLNQISFQFFQSHVQTCVQIVVSDGDFFGVVLYNLDCVTTGATPPLDVQQIVSQKVEYMDFDYSSSTLVVGGTQTQIGAVFGTVVWNPSVVSGEYWHNLQQIQYSSVASAVGFAPLLKRNMVYIVAENGSVYRASTLNNQNLTLVCLATTQLSSTAATTNGPNANFLVLLTVDSQQNLVLVAVNDVLFVPPVTTATTTTSSTSTSSERLTKMLITSKSSASGVLSSTTSFNLQSVTTSASQEFLQLVSYELGKQVTRLSIQSATQNLGTQPKTQQQLAAEQQLFIYATAGIVGLVLVVCAVAVFVVRGRKSKVRRNTSDQLYRPAEADSTVMSSTVMGSTIPMSSTVMAGGSTTMFNTQMRTVVTSQREISLPAYMSMIINIDYKLEKPLGEGGFATVFSAKLLSAEGLARNGDDSRCAVKVIKAKDGVSQQEREADLLVFQQEVSMLNFFSSNKNFVKLLGFAQQPSKSIVMKFYGYGSVEDVLNGKSKAVSWSLELMVPLVIDTIGALALMHAQGFLHADVKLGNIMLDRESETARFHAVLSDFGIAQIVTQQAMLVKQFQKSQLEGVSIAYAAPELLNRLKTGDAGSQAPQDRLKLDVYAMAIVAFEMVTRQPAWSKLTDDEVMSMVLAGERPAFQQQFGQQDAKLIVMRQAIERAWSQSVNERPTMAELQVMLQ